MGSKGSKPRKPKHSQHLPKVGTATENQRLLHEEENAVLRQMGLGKGSSSAVRVTMTVVVRDRRRRRHHCADRADGFLSPDGGTATSAGQVVAVLVEHALRRLDVATSR